MAYERAGYVYKSVQKKPQRGEDEAEAVSDRGEDCVRGVAFAAFDTAAPEMAVGLHVSDHGFDGGAAFELALDGTVDP